MQCRACDQNASYQMLWYYVILDSNNIQRYNFTYIAEDCGQFVSMVKSLVFAVVAGTLGLLNARVNSALVLIQWYLQVVMVRSKGSRPWQMRVI
jgi:hypothetical protein